MLHQTKPCPHCNSPIKLSPKEKVCPSCNKGVKLHKPFKEAGIAFLIWCVVMIPLLMIYLSLFGSATGTGFILFVGASYVPLMLYVLNKRYFEKDE